MKSRDPRMMACSACLALLLSPIIVIRGLALPKMKQAEPYQRIHSTIPTRLHQSSSDSQIEFRNMIETAASPRVAGLVLVAPQSSSTSPTASLALSPLESWCIENLQEKYNQALSIKCPFFRRRAADMLDSIDLVMRFLIIRHKSLPLEPPGWRCDGDTTPKRVGLSHQELMEVIRHDWRPDTHKGYYITGRLSTSVFRDDCVFDGPDPDMPVRGLRKYLNAASQLFDHQKSRSELLSLNIDQEKGVIVAQWRMKGVLRLPWRPSVPSWTGSTTYYTDKNGLVYRHEETWDKSVLQAFMQTLWPEVADRIWDRAVEE